MIELIYLENSEDYEKVKKELEAEFPYASIRDESDDVHPYRLSIKGKIMLDYFARWALVKRIFLCCLQLRMIATTNVELVKKWINQTRKLRGVPEIKQ